MTPEMLKAQVLPDAGSTAVTPSAPTAAVSEPPASAAPNATEPPATSEPPVESDPNHCASSAIEKPVTVAVAVDVDPSLAFIDRKGEDVVEDTSESVAGAKRPVDESPEATSKRTKLDEPVVEPSPSTPIPTEAASTVTHYFHQVPMTLPNTPACPHMLFDRLENEEEVQDNTLLERLSEVLADSAVFQGVRDLLDNQRQRDRDTLARWQDLVGMQMKEGSELFARHMDLEKDVNDPRELIALKTQHHEQRAEFVHRCKMSQQQFIDICEMDRSNALRAQQISLQNMKIPEMSVTTETSAIDKQVSAGVFVLLHESMTVMDGDRRR
ncbi:hypothetical protein PINS_up005784 [Pythium insidiosum]|nr:hypothetical protein PINS_up005784 [Pythium insidiosum]